ncbi:MAG: hypothetical protein J7M25_12675 [Deltaproteobacteria bacterium]|nr:hypothetical protein [Deltaproteobacteria bacterium]
MADSSPADMLRRFVLDFLVEQALKKDPFVDGRSRKALAASFSIEPLVDLGNARKYRIINTETAANRRVYLFFLGRPSTDHDFPTTEICFKRAVAVLRDGLTADSSNHRDLLVRERIRRQRSHEQVGLILTEVMTPHPKQAPLDVSEVTEIPRSLLALGIVEAYPAGSFSAEDTPETGRLVRTPMWAPDRQDMAHQDFAPQVSVHDWLQRAYKDTFGEPPIHVSTSSEQGPVYTVRVKEITPKHEQWVIEVTRHLRVREGALKLQVQLLDVR